MTCLYYPLDMPCRAAHAVSCDILFDEKLIMYIYLSIILRHVGRSVGRGVPRVFRPRKSQWSLPMSKEPAWTTPWSEHRPSLGLMQKIVAERVGRVSKGECLTVGCECLGYLGEVPHVCVLGGRAAMIALPGPLEGGGSAQWKIGTFVLESEQCFFFTGPGKDLFL